MRQQNRSNLRPTATAVLLVIAAGQACSAAAFADDDSKVANRVVPPNGNVANGTEHQLMPFIQMARASRDAVLAVRDYEAVFTKREMVGRTMYAGQMQIKLRHEPFNVYLRFIDRNNGREVIYAGPRYKGMMMAHEGQGLSSLVGTISLEPTSARAMAEGRHPITEIGMAKMMTSLLRQWEAEMKLGDPNDPKVLYYPSAKMGNIECQAVVSTHETPTRKPRFYQTRVFFDKKSNFPIRLEQYNRDDGGQPYLVEEYMYTNIRANVGLSDQDFDIHNRSYHF